MKKYNILSLFDGPSIAQLAFTDLGLKIENYFASEIDKDCIKVTQIKFPETIQLGDVVNWKSWNIDFSKIDIIIGGSPCQGFSFSGKQLNFNDERSKLFFIFVDVLKHIKKLNPKIIFMLENVKMKKTHLSVISQHLEIIPKLLNSNLITAQNRPRYYWCNLQSLKLGLFQEEYTFIVEPKDEMILAKNILKPLKDIPINFIASEIVLKNIIMFNNYEDKNIVGHYHKAGQKGFVFDENSKISCLCASDYKFPKLILQNNVIRKLTPIEYCILQSIPEDYFFHENKQIISNSKIYNCVGNSFTPKMISHIFKPLLKLD